MEELCQIPKIDFLDFLYNKKKKFQKYISPETLVSFIIMFLHFSKKIYISKKLYSRKNAGNQRAHKPW